MRRAAAVLFVVMGAVSCAESPTPPTGGAPDPEPSTVTISATYDQSTCCYIEGFIPVVRLVGSGVDVQEEFKTREGVVEVVLEVPRGGEYTLESWVEPCAGNCGYRDPPTDHCSEKVTIPDGTDLTVDLTIRSTHPCELSVEGQ